MDDRTPTLSYDALILVLEWLCDDHVSLNYCSRVSRSFRDASATFLYRNVTYSPVFSAVLDLRKKDDFAEGFFASAQLPHHAKHVRRLEISGFLSTRPPPLNKFPGQLKAAMECWPAINTLVLTPQKFHEDMFTDVLPLVLGLPNLRHLTVNTACTGEAHASTLTQLRKLHSLTIQSPTRAILQVLPGWLKALRQTLRKFHLTHSCGSVTPGVLCSFVPLLQDVTSIGLGLSYSLTDEDVFTFWNALPNLHSLDFRYYLQLRRPSVPRIRHLRDVTIRYTNVDERPDVDYLCRYIRQVVAYSALERLRLVCENEVQGASPAFNPLVEHLYLKHATTLRALHMPDCFVSFDAIVKLCRKCKSLEELSVAISADMLNEFPGAIGRTQHLRTVNLKSRNTKHPVKLTQEEAEKFILPKRSIRHLSVDGERFEGRYALAADGTVQFVVERDVSQRRVFPWEKGSQQA